MRIVIDLDGTICEIKKPNQSYADVKPMPGAAERIRELKAANHYIIISTARNMQTCDSNVGKVLRNVGKVTLDWLEQHGIYYDEIYFGKPNAEVYIDDRALLFEDWAAITEQAIQDRAKSR